MENEFKPLITWAAKREDELRKVYPKMSDEQIHDIVLSQVKRIREVYQDVVAGNIKTLYKMIYIGGGNLVESLRVIEAKMENDGAKVIAQSAWAIEPKSYDITELLTEKELHYE